MKDNSEFSSHKKLIVWQKSFELVKTIYKLTKTFPKEELFVLTSQIRRSALSIPCNIAEGESRKTTKEYIQFLHVAYGSTAELETQLRLAFELEYCSEKDFISIHCLLIEVRKIINTTLISLKRKISRR